MILKITVEPEDIIYNDKGKILIRLRYYSGYSTAAHLVVTDGVTVEDFDKNPGKDNASLFVSSKGKISVEKNR